MMASLFIIFDGVKNSVFYSQVLLPAITLAKHNLSQKCVIISFEIAPEKAIATLRTFGVLPSNLSVLIWQRLPFWGEWSLRLVAKHVKNWLLTFNSQEPEQLLEVTCRGVFAATILRFALELFVKEKSFEKIIKLDNTPVIIPVIKVWILLPGIASAEVLLVNNRLSFFAQILARLKAFFFSHLAYRMECKIFQMPFVVDGHDCFILRYIACTRALKEYLCSCLAANPLLIFELEDPPFAICTSVLEKLQTRLAIRQVLQIDFAAPLYCYLGGMQSWQSFDLAVIKFLECKAKDPEAKFLVLTTDSLAAKNILHDYGVCADDYRLLSLKSQEVAEYLLACDYGLIMREANLVNYTARPIKVLEYKQAGLLVIHNYTVAWVSETC